MATFIRAALWGYGERQRTGAEVPPAAPPRVNASRIEIFRDTLAMIGTDCSDADVDAVAARWDNLLDRETGGDEDTKVLMMDAWKQRRTWPKGFRDYIASLYAMEWDEWEMVATFIENGRASERLSGVIDRG
jgi:hypothetical protein